MLSKRENNFWIVVGIAIFFLFGIPRGMGAVLNRLPDEKVIGQEDFTDWKQKYYEFLTTDSAVTGWLPAQEEYLTCSLIYVNDDEIPEIYLCGSITAGGDLLLSYCNEEVQCYCVSHYGGVYAERTGYFGDFNGRQGSYWNQVYQYEKGGLVFKEEGYYAEEYINDDNNDVWVADGFVWEHQSMTEEEYYAALSQAVEGNEMKRCYENGIFGDGSYEELLDYLRY